MKRTSLILALSLTALLVATTSQAQVASLLLAEGDAVPGAPGFTVDNIRSVMTNGAGGFAIIGNMAMLGGSRATDFIWGSPDGLAPPTLLFQVGTYAGLDQLNWDSTFGFSANGSVCYSSTGVGFSFVDSCWVDDTPIAVYDDPATVPGMFWNTMGAPNMTTAGLPWFVGNLSSAPGGPATSSGLFVGATPAPLVLGGDALPNLPFGLASPFITGRVELAENGSEYIMIAILGPPAVNGNDRCLVQNGAGLVLDGTLVRQDNVVPASVFGDGTRTWERFDLLGLGEDGHYFFTGELNGGPLTDTDFIAVDGVIRYFEGDTLDGRTLRDHTAARMNDNGQLAHIWSTTDDSNDVLFVDDEFVLRENDAVDLDGDGLVDGETELLRFNASVGFPYELAFGENGDLYFLGQGFDHATGTSYDGLFRIPVTPPPAIYCQAKQSSAGCVTRMSMGSSAAPTSGTADYALVANEVQGQKNGLIFAGTAGPANLAFNGGTLCVRPPLRRGPLQNSGFNVSPFGCDGSLSQVVNAGPIFPFGLDAGPGNSGWYQWWYRDPNNGAGAFGSALSDAVQLDFQF